jgi:hypothetical protein
VFASEKLLQEMDDKVFEQTRACHGNSRDH